MRKALLAIVAVVPLAVAAPRAHAVGCISGGVVGAIGGHMAHHGVLGAIGGCIAGHEWHKHQVSRQQLKSRDDYVRERQRQDPSYRDPWSD